MNLKNRNSVGSHRLRAEGCGDERALYVPLHIPMEGKQVSAALLRTAPNLHDFPTLVGFLVQFWFVPTRLFPPWPLCYIMCSSESPSSWELHIAKARASLQST